MTSVQQRQKLLGLIDKACADRVRLHCISCKVILSRLMEYTTADLPISQKRADMSGYSHRPNIR